MIIVWCIAGDIVKKNSHLQKLALMIQKQQEEGLTFEPKISQFAKEMNKSVLKLSEDPSRHLGEMKE
jgi:hypothetical protein